MTDGNAVPEHESDKLQGDKLEQVVNSGVPRDTPADRTAHAPDSSAPTSPNAGAGKAAA